ncbi:helix-turn-helix domain-containing protein [Rhodococcus coprophilus]|uniref:Putative Xre family DNA-binding protein n=1 Tax=Rhodococcus coprophilus TaxID=38310 RepID=A0A2X4U7M6_9NOCA|nr:helix-turn-helix transcriptional regulator [Rhodococcus coprophilus]MBM7457741.1 ribosome-binding protein aMBF1 (putative translation factor) [Rhodococcus coprophilus]SQI30362.1 putative Xre family DNA-binding protein [Rhodococcus coprophilus]
MDPKQDSVVDLAAARAARVYRQPEPRAAEPQPRLLRQIYGEILRDERRDQDRSLDDVARAVGMSKQYLSEVERGRKEASSEMMRSVCDALDLPMEQLLSRGIRRITAHRTLRVSRSGGVELCAA